jgi:hypothetical protein
LSRFNAIHRPEATRIAVSGRVSSNGRFSGGREGEVSNDPYQRGGFRRLPDYLDIDAFADGILAHRAGVELHENPHSGDNVRLSWSIGWNERAGRVK